MWCCTRATPREAPRDPHACSAGTMPRHNNVIPNAHFRKQWDVRALSTHHRIGSLRSILGLLRAAQQHCEERNACRTHVLTWQGSSLGGFSPAAVWLVSGSRALTDVSSVGFLDAQVRVRTWFSQPARKRSRREGAPCAREAKRPRSRRFCTSGARTLALTSSPCPGSPRGEGQGRVSAPCGGRAAACGSGADEAVQHQGPRGPGVHVGRAEDCGHPRQVRTDGRHRG